MLHRIIERVGEHSPGIASNKNSKSIFSLQGLGLISNKLHHHKPEEDKNKDRPAGLKTAWSFLHKGDEKKGTLVSRHYVWILIASLVAYVLVHIIIRLNTTTVCNVREPFSPYTIFVAVAILGCYGLSTIYFLLSAILTSSWSQEEVHVKSVFYCSATIVLIAGCATGLYLTDDGSIVCQDALGIASMNAQWAEWLIEAPLLSYIANAIEDKARLSRADYISIFLTGMSIVFGFILNCFPNGNLVAGIILWILSTLCMSVQVVIAFDADFKANKRVSHDKMTQRWKSERTKTKSKLAYLLAVLFPVFR